MTEEKLKTLKDLEQPSPLPYPKPEPFIFSCNLRQEAINDIKIIGDFKDNGKNMFSFLGETTEKFIDKRKTLIDYIKFKFNITDEELR